MNSKRFKNEYGQSVTICNRLKMAADDGKMRDTDPCRQQLGHYGTTHGKFFEMEQNSAFNRIHIMSHQGGHEC